MNWKDDPKLFIGFQVLTSDVVMNIYGVERIVTTGIDSLVFILEKDGIKIKEGVDSCTLIARRVENMTDEEEKDCLRLMEGYCGEYGNDDIALFVCQTSEGLLYALSIGVLPEYFEWDETVIDINELEESK